MKTIKFVAIIVASAVVALFVTLAVDELGVLGYRYAFVTVYAVVAGVTAALLGAFRDERSASRYDSIRHKTGRNYGQAAVFIGTTCLFVGTPQECEEVADDMQHYAQQAEVKKLTGNEVFDVL